MATTVTVYDFLSNESSTKWKGLLQSALRRVNASCMRQLCVCIYVTNTFGHIYHFVHIPPTLLWTHLSVFCYMYIQAVYVSVCVCVCLCVSVCASVYKRADTWDTVAYRGCHWSSKPGIVVPVVELFVMHSSSISFVIPSFGVIVMNVQYVQ